MSADARSPEGDATHDWQRKRFMKGIVLDACARCGIVRRSDRLHKACPGTVHVTLRQAGAPGSAHDTPSAADTPTYPIHGAGGRSGDGGGGPISQRGETIPEGVPGSVGRAASGVGPVPRVYDRSARAAFLPLH